MKDRKEEIGIALIKATRYYADHGQGVVAYTTDETALASSVVEVVAMMTKLIRSEGDHFRKAATGKPRRIRSTGLGKSFLQSVTNTDVEKVRFHFHYHEFNPLFDLFDRQTSGLGFAATMICDDDVDVCNACISAIRAEARSKIFRKRLNDHDRAARKNHASFTRYARKLCSIYSALYGLRIDLGYRQQYWSSMASRDFVAHRKQFLLNFKKFLPEGLFSGYAWRLEFSERRFVNAHLIIFVDGRFAHETVNATMALKRCWEETVTLGKGLFIDRGLSHYQYNGTGKIADHDRAARESLRQVITSMTMPDRYIKLTVPENHRTFGKGAVPKKAAINRSKRLLVEFIPGVDSPPARQEQFVTGVDSPQP
ncbi:hypothetical protein [Rhodanobacter sp. C05]|uniref:hypothetical protein n=1 Tax=Rhodanobacter sp. C05 TaxID=1945855 RepID=UPI00098479A0|nr:hypothetical protein [Rhodanobacter sp. C05]OOG38622.1 hypothetical protein B0E51_13840 [Rhodanobacter sp. C05]